MSLSCVDTPEAINLGNVDICCMCRGITVVGIYQMIDPEEIYFKQFKKADNLFAYDLGFSEEEQWGEEDER